MFVRSPAKCNKFSWKRYFAQTWTCRRAARNWLAKEHVGLYGTSMSGLLLPNAAATMSADVRSR